MVNQKMDPEVKELWTKALLSGEFKQSKGALRTEQRDEHGNVTGHSYCCLGVLCELYRRQTTEGSWREADGAFMAPTDTDTVVLPAGVREWAGLSARNPEITIDGETHEAAVFNDGGSSTEALTFADIARGIEESL